jgi:hypothetical protein
MYSVSLKQNGTKSMVSALQGFSTGVLTREVLCVHEQLCFFSWELHTCNQNTGISLSHTPGAYLHMVFLEHASSPLTPCEGQAPQQSPSSLPLAASLSSFLHNEEVAIVLQEVWTKHGKTGSLMVYPDWTRVIMRFFFICIWFISGNMVEYLMVIYTRKFPGQGSLSTYHLREQSLKNYQVK